MKRKRPAGRIVAIVIAGVALVFANSLGLLAPLRAFTSWAMTPVGAVIGKAGNKTGGAFDLVAHIKDLGAENARLTGEIADLRQQVSELAELKHQNEILRKQLNFNAAEERKLLAAEVIAYQPDNFRQFLTINRGTSQGLVEGMAVMAEGTLVGRVSEVSTSSAKVFLVTDPNFRVSSLDQETRATGTVRGQIGSGLIMDRISQSDRVESGDTIITSGLGGELPKGLIIGRVESVDKKDNAVFQTARVLSGLNFNKLEIVFVVVEK